MSAFLGNNAQIPNEAEMIMRSSSRDFTCFLLATVLIVVLSATRMDAATLTYDIANDFSGTSNPNGAWSYGYKGLLSGSPTGAFSLSTSQQFTPYPGWYGVAGEIWQNESGTTAFSIAPGAVAVNADSNSTSTVRWTAPASGKISFTGAFGPGDNYPNDPRNGGVFLDNASLWQQQTPGSFSFSNQSVSQGDTLDFTVWGNPNGFGNTQVGSTILFTPVPEPGSLALLGVGGIGLLACAWRRRRAT